MDVFAALADHYVKSTHTADVGHSATPHAPRQPVVERHRLLRSILARLRGRRGPTTGPAGSVAGYGGCRPVRSPGTVPGG